MRAGVVIVLLFLGAWLTLDVRAQVHGASILGNTGTTNRAAAASLANPPEEPAIAALKKLTNGGPVGFDCLAGFDFSLTDELQSNTNRPAWADTQVNAMIPQKIRALDGREVSIDGFMIPTIYEKDKVTEFLLARDPMGCCYSTVPLMDQFVKVRVKSPGVKEMMYAPARVRGMLHVGAERENGELTSIYRMEALRVDNAPEE